AVSRQRFVPGIRAEPFIALGSRFKPSQFFVREFEKIFRLLDDRGINARMREKVLLSHRERIAGRAGLLEATVRLAKKGLKRVRHAGKRSGIDRDARFDAAANHFARKREFKRGGTVAFEHAALGAFVRETLWLDIELAADGVAIETRFRVECEIGKTGELTDLNLQQTARAFFCAECDPIAEDRKSVV